MKIDFMLNKVLCENHTVLCVNYTKEAIQYLQSLEILRSIKWQKPEITQNRLQFYVIHISKRF